MTAGQDHLTCGGFDAWIIVVDGVKATAYDINRGEEEQLNCWISSATDRVRADSDLVLRNLHPHSKYSTLSLPRSLGILSSLSLACPTNRVCSFHTIP
jgi:hypothetical protein